MPSSFAIQHPSFVLCAVLLASVASAQAGAPTFERRYVHDTGRVAAPVGQAAVTAAFVVDVPAAAWVRLYFSDIELASGAKLRFTAVLDAAVQELDTRTATQWGNASAYFNGDRVLVELLTEPNGNASRVRLEHVEFGLPIYASVCGSTDDRSLSNDARTARFMPSECTAWLIDDCNHGFLSAGHCGLGTNPVVEFNVPMSNANGTINHPGPDDQYAVDIVSRQGVNGGIGNDWSYFGAFANAGTGLTPFEAQQTTYQLATPPAFNPATVLRLTGYGTDSTPQTFNQVQQTAFGAWFGSAGSALSYLVDTTGGNSGSAVGIDGTPLAIGIHTHGGCNASQTQANAGTSLANAGLQAALAAPRGVLSCTGTSSTYCTAKINSQGCLPSVQATGIPTVSGGAGSFVIRALNVLNNQNGIFFYGETPASIPFQNGTLCVTGTIVRTGIQNSGGNPPPADCSGVYTVDMGARIAAGIDPRLVVGATIVGQFWSRDPASPVFHTGLTNAIQFTIGP